MFLAAQFKCAAQFQLRLRQCFVGVAAADEVRFVEEALGRERLLKCQNWLERLVFNRDLFGGRAASFNSFTND